jgi:hypothetical protein
VHHLAPELDEHHPEVAVLVGQRQAAPDDGPQPTGRIRRPLEQDVESPIQIGHDRVEGRDENRALVLEVVVQDSLADARLAGHLLRPEARRPVAGQAAEGRPDDLFASERRDAELRAHADTPAMTRSTLG